MSATGDRYRFSYGPGTPYSHAVGLVERWRAPGGEVVVDLGCGFGAIAEPVRDRGLTYLGVDLEASGLRSLESRGFEVLTSDVCEPTKLLDGLATALAGRSVAAITALDCLEHLPNASEVLRALSTHAAATGGAPLVVSIPNVSHRDVATKLLIGRWDVTPTGLLDATHVRFFAPSTLTTTMTETGWAQLEAHDFEREESDQHFPADCPVLLPTTPSGALLRRVRAMAAPGNITNQFVRAYRPDVAPLAGTGPGSDAVARPTAADAGQPPFLSVLVTTEDASLPALDPLLGSLCAQASDDFEVVIASHPTAGAQPRGQGTGTDVPFEEALRRRHRALGDRVHVIVPDEALPDEALPDAALPDAALPDASAVGRADAHPTLRAVLAARGRYVAFLDAGDVAEPNWVTELLLTAAPEPGRVLDAGRERDAHLLGVLATHPGALSAFAFPRSIFVDMGIQLRHRDASSEWRLVVDAVQLCGLSPTPSRDLVRRPTHQARADDLAVPGTTRTQIVAALDRDPLLLDRGSATVLVELRDERDTLARACEHLRVQLAAMHGSTSWRVTAPLRVLTGWLRHR